MLVLGGIIIVLRDSWKTVCCVIRRVLSSLRASWSLLLQERVDLLIGYVPFLLGTCEGRALLNEYKLDGVLLPTEPGTPAPHRVRWEEVRP